MQSVALIGGGNSGLAMAAHLAMNGHPVRLWSRSENTLIKLKKTRKINIKGVIEGTVEIDVVTNDIKEALHGAQLIFVTIPANGHRELGYCMAEHLEEDSIIVLNPGRTFGAVEFRQVLKECLCKVNTTIAETQSIIYTCRKIAPDSVLILTMKNGILLSTFNPGENSTIINMLPGCLKGYFTPAESIIDTSFGNVGMILHCIPVLLNTGWIENSFTVFKHYYNGITPSIAAILEKLDVERVTVTKALGRAVESTLEWLKRIYKAKGNNLFKAIQSVEAYRTIDAPPSLRHRYIYEDIPCGLVPLEAVGKSLGFPMKITELTIDLANSILNEDFRQSGRNLRKLGLEKKNIEELLKAQPFMQI